MSETATTAAQDQQQTEAPFGMKTYCPSVAVLHFLDPREWECLASLFLERYPGHKGYILVRGLTGSYEYYNHYRGSNESQLPKNLGEVVAYDFGGNPDCALELVHTEDRAREIFTDAEARGLYAPHQRTGNPQGRCELKPGAAPGEGVYHRTNETEWQLLGRISTGTLNQAAGAIAIHPDLKDLVLKLLGTEVEKLRGRTLAINWDFDRDPAIWFDRVPCGGHWAWNAFRDHKKRLKQEKDLMEKLKQEESLQEPAEELPRENLGDTPDSEVEEPQKAQEKPSRPAKKKTTTKKDASTKKKAKRSTRKTTKTKKKKASAKKKTVGRKKITKSAAKKKSATRATAAKKAKGSRAKRG